MIDSQSLQGCAWILEPTPATGTSDTLALQGWPQAVAKVEAWRKHNPDKVLREMAGNGMCLGVLRRVLKAILVSRGILH